MRRRMAMLLAVAAVSGVMTLFSPTASPVRAAEVCAGQGAAQLTTNSLYYPVIGENSTAGIGTGSAVVTLTPRSSAFNIHITTGTCVPSLAAISAGGNVHGWCGLSIGDGFTSFGNPFHWFGVGSVLVLTGGVTGVVNAVPNALAGDSCATSPGANDFLVTGAVVTTSCTIQPLGTSASLASLPIPALTGSLPFISFHVTTGGHFHLKSTVCA